ncbi:MAG: ethylbenzene dehydrogenase-related protein [Anaerolineales bacterium]|nr:ethylbenzene dehydrogenase-related protein [Anaerolineales bacterium]
MGANWTNGKWTVEMIRARDTGYSDDVQFTDMERVYDFGISLWNHSDLLAPLMRFLPGKMVFDLKEDTR